MLINSVEKNLLNKSLDIISEIRTLFYEILNTYTLQQFHFKENFSIYNKILQIDENENKIIKNPDKLLSKLISDLTSLNIVLEELNSLPYNNKTNNDYQSIITNEENKYLLYIKLSLMKYNIKSNLVPDLCCFDSNIFFNLNEKQLLIEKYFKKLKIKCGQKNSKLKEKEYIQIKIIVHNLFCVIIMIPNNISKLYENEFQNKIKIIVNAIYGPTNINYEENKNFNNYSNYLLFKKLSVIFNDKFKEIIKEINKSKEQKICFYECFLLFLDYIYDYDKIFKIKCEKCFSHIKYISKDKYFSIPLLKVQIIDEKYQNKLFNDINKGNDINNTNKIFHFYHQECINYFS